MKSHSIVSKKMHDWLRKIAPSLIVKHAHTSGVFYKYRRMTEEYYPEPDFKPNGEGWVWNNKTNEWERPITAEELAHMRAVTANRGESYSGYTMKFIWDENVKEVYPPYYAWPTE